MARKKVTMTMYLLPEQAKALRELSAARRIPASQLVRDGIDMALVSMGQDGRKLPARAERLTQAVTLDADRLAAEMRRLVVYSRDLEVRCHRAEQRLVALRNVLRDMGGQMDLAVDASTD
jgi:hypothetical protein